MAEVLKTRFQLRRGLESVWAKNNPILAAGEPGYTIDTNKLKVGDGETPWNDLLFVNEEASALITGVFGAETIDDFPLVGDINVIYKARKEKQLYQWNEESQEYELLVGNELQEEETLILYGGSASDNVEV